MDSNSGCMSWLMDFNQKETTLKFNKKSQIDVPINSSMKSFKTLIKNHLNFDDIYTWIDSQRNFYLFFNVSYNIIYTYLPHFKHDTKCKNRENISFFFFGLFNLDHWFLRSKKSFGRQFHMDHWDFHLNHSIIFLIHTFSFLVFLIIRNLRYKRERLISLLYLSWIMVWS